LDNSAQEASLVRNRSLIAALASLAVIVLASTPISAGPGSFTTALRGRAYGQVAVDPSNSKIVYAAGNDVNYNPYVYKSFDSGNTWAAVGTGLGQMGVYALAVSKPNPQLVYLGGYNFTSHAIALYRSTDGGANWTAVATNLGDNSVQDIALDPTNAGISYLALNHGVAKSIDNTNWTLLGGMGTNNVQALSIDTSSVPILYAGTNASTNPGVWKSADGGQTWANVNNGLASGSVFYLAIDPTIQSTIYAGVSAGAGQPTQLTKTVNSGQNWTNLIVTDAITSLAVDPLNGLNVYYETGGAVYRSGDGGSTWTQIHTAGGGALALDTINPQTIYAGASDGVASFTAAPPPVVGQATPVTTTPAGSGQSFTFPQTGHTVSGIWLDFLRTHGDVDNLGYPRTEVFQDSQIQNQTVQYFQRLVLEYHPEQPTAYQIQRRLLGDLLYPGSDPAVDEGAPPPGDYAYFQNFPARGLGHFVANVAPDGSPTLFKQYFDTHGKEDAFGYPKEEPKIRTLTDGQPHWTQRFQAAVFEYHQENDRDGNNPDGVPWRNFRVQLELLGDKYITARNLPYR
jgi:photosystem II stability/assembly factor-like uncharacterized protein